MTKFSVSFWNIENFWGQTARASRVRKHLEEIHDGTNPPDVVAFCEIKDKGKIRDVIKDEFSEYDFGMTDTGGYRAIQRDKPEIELLVGWRRSAFDQAIFTQRVDLKGENSSVRPGALLNVRIRRTWYSLLFLHTKSGANQDDYDARNESLNKLWNLNQALIDLDDSRYHTEGSRFLVMGDLNTMGNGRGVSGSREVSNLERKASENDMHLFNKSHDLTFSQRDNGGRLESNLDHVLGSRIDLKRQGTRNGASYHVRVYGWNQLQNDRQALHAFEDDLSDHSALYVEVEN